MSFLQIPQAKKSENQALQPMHCLFILLFAQTALPCCYNATYIAVQVVSKLNAIKLQGLNINLTAPFIKLKRGYNNETTASLINLNYNSHDTTLFTFLDAAK